MTPSLTVSNFRRAYALSVEDMARLMKVHPQTVLGLESGRFDDVPDLAPEIEFQLPAKIGDQHGSTHR